MSPRKTHDGRVPRWVYKSLGRKRKAVVEGPFQCPRCGNRTLTLKVEQESKTVKAKCGCGFSKSLEFRGALQPVDYYGKLIDHHYGQK